MKENLTERLEPYLRFQIQKRAITLTQNNYTGFDTEFSLKDDKKHLNSLLSIQLANQTRTIIRIPLNTSLDLSYIHPLTSEISKLTSDKDKDQEPGKVNEIEKSLDELKILNSSLKLGVKNLRLKFTLTDFIHSTLIEKLQQIKGVKYFEDLKRDQIVFAFPLTNLKTSIIFPKEAISFSDMIQQSNDLVKDDLVISIKNVIFKIKEDFDFDWEKILGWIEDKKQSEFCRRRTVLTFKFLDQKANVPISLVKNNYLCAHYSAADLCMLSDFLTLKEKLGIVNKSFVTLGKPIKTAGTNVYIRDTYLLAPAGNKSLAALGKLYESEGDFSKELIKPEDLVNMDEFLKRDKESFTYYAIKDAVITLKHALSMEEFNFGIKQLGVPLTLSSMGKNYVLDE
jgi:hypothetical protein